LTDPDDRKGQICTKCGVGNYQETNIYDDWDGVLHCTNKECNHEVKRYKWKDNPPPKPEKVKLSPAAQTVFYAFNSKFDWIEDGVPGLQFNAIAAALRAAANEVAPETPESELDDPDMLKGIWSERRTIREELLAIADELEKQ
jgi:hypothetical protein